MFFNEKDNTNGMKKKMRLSLRQRQTTQMRLQIKPVLIFSCSCFAIVFAAALLFNNVGNVTTVKAASTTETIDSGSFIVNMGIVPQTVGNALVPYGMVYDLIKNYNTPVKWIINDSKAKDGTDFTYNAVAYKGGPFIIPAAFITSTIKTRITFWQGKGVQGIYTTSSLSAPVYSTLTAMPTMTIDNTDGKQAIITGYFDNALIPSSAYSVGPTTALSTCHDLWINPHGDPTWATHSRLYNFATTDGSFIFSQCHATSMMEGCKNPASPFQQLNFLSTTGLQCYGAGNCGSAITQTHAGNPTAPFTYNNANDPMMQFMGTIDAALNGGSEDWYIPQTTGAWRATTNAVLTTNNGPAGGKGVLLVYGPAYGMANSGWVMYEASHDFGGTTAAEVGAQRAFLNFMIFAASKKSISFTSTSIPTSFANNSSTTTTLGISVSSGTPPYTYQWGSSISGASFGSPTSATTTFKLPPGLAKKDGLITVQVTDACSRQNFLSQPITITSSALPVSLIEFKAELNKNNNTVELNWKTATEKDNDYFTVERTKDGKNFTELARINGAGNSNVIKQYNYIDNQPFIGTSYYRLKQTDYNGASETFRMIPVNVTSKGVKTIQVYPNPFVSQFTAKFESDEEKEVQITLFNSNGAVIHTETMMATSGINSYQYNGGEQLNSGMYFLKIADEKSLIGSVQIKHSIN